MIYSAHITTPKNTAATAPKRSRLYVTNGLVYRVEFYFPYGSAGLMGVGIYDGLFSVWPSTVGEWLLADGVLISFDDLYLKEAAPFQFDILTYNTDDTYDHIVDVRLGMVSKRVYQARYMPTISWEYFVDMLATLQARQQAEWERQQKQREQTPQEWLAEMLKE